MTYTPQQEALAIFSDLRLKLDSTDLMRYYDEDKVYWLINMAEEMVKSRLDYNYEWRIMRERIDSERAGIAA